MGPGRICHKCYFCPRRTSVIYRASSAAGERTPNERGIFILLFERFAGIPLLSVRYARADIPPPRHHIDNNSAKTGERTSSARNKRKLLFSALWRCGMSEHTQKLEYGQTTCLHAKFVRRYPVDLVDQPRRDSCCEVAGLQRTARHRHRSDGAQTARTK